MCSRPGMLFTSRSQEAEAELQAADPPPLLVVDVALVGRTQRRGLAVQHGHSVDGAAVLESNFTGFFHFPVSWSRSLSDLSVPAGGGCFGSGAASAWDCCASAPPPVRS